MNYAATDNRLGPLLMSVKYEPSEESQSECDGFYNIILR